MKGDENFKPSSGVQLHMAMHECSSGDGLTPDDLLEMAYSLISQAATLVEDGQLLEKPQLINMLTNEVLRTKQYDLALLLKGADFEEIGEIHGRYL